MPIPIDAFGTTGVDHGALDLDAVGMVRAAQRSHMESQRERVVPHRQPADVMMYSANGACVMIRVAAMKAIDTYHNGAVS
jgi:hypothetical protein